MAEENMESIKRQTLGSIRNDMLEPTKALIEASSLAGAAWTKNFIETNFIVEKNKGGAIDLSKPMQARMIECEFEVMKNGVAGKAMMKVPLLSIAPTPCVAMSGGTITHDYEITISDTNEAGAEATANIETGTAGSFYGVGFSTKASFTASANYSHRRQTDARATIHVEQLFNQVPLSEGFLRLQETLLTAAIPA